MVEQIWNQEFSIINQVIEENENWNEDYKQKLKKHQSCFIATAAYGTPFYHEIDVLRMWRDMTLKKSMVGRMFIRTYYTFSPPVAWVISKSKILRGLTRFLLKPIVGVVGKGRDEGLASWREKRERVNS